MAHLRRVQQIPCEAAGRRRAGVMPLPHPFPFSKHESSYRDGGTAPATRAARRSGRRHVRPIGQRVPTAWSDIGFTKELERIRAPVASIVGRKQEEGLMRSASDGMHSKGVYHSLRWPFGRRSRHGPLAAAWLRETVREGARLRPSPPVQVRARREVDEAEVYRDLEVVTDAESAALILCRGIALRVALRADRHRDPDREIERAAAEGYVHRWRATHHGAEAGAVARVIRLAAHGQSPALAQSVFTVAGHALRLGHDDGAFECFRAAFELAVATGAHETGALAAAALARMSEVDVGTYAARAWRRRARVLANRARRERPARRG